MRFLHGDPGLIIASCIGIYVKIWIVSTGTYATVLVLNICTANIFLSYFKFSTWKRLMHFTARLSLCVSSNLYYESHLIRQLNPGSLRCSWSMAGRRSSSYIFILDLTPSFSGLGKYNCKTRRESFWGFGASYIRKFAVLIYMIWSMIQSESVRRTISPSQLAMSPLGCYFTKGGMNIDCFD